jgi:sugar phosphate isomerase/epimerase
LEGVEKRIIVQSRLSPTRRTFLAALSAGLARAGEKLPQNRNIKWAVSLGLWGHFNRVPFTDVLDVMQDTGFIGIRLTGFPGFLKSYNIRPETIEKETAKRGLQVATISFNGPAYDPAQQARYLTEGRRAMEFLKGQGANRLVCFSPNRSNLNDAAFKTMCQSFNRLGEIGGEMGFKVGLHNHLDQMVEKAEEIDQCMEKTDAKLFGLAPDTAHLLLAGADPVKTLGKYRNRLIFLDYKDARWTDPTVDLKLPNGRVYTKESHAARFLNSIYDLGDGDVDFPGCHQVLKKMHYQGWICVDLDIARNGPKASYQRCGRYIVSKLEPIYA